VADEWATRMEPSARVDASDTPGERVMLPPAGTAYAWSNCVIPGISPATEPLPRRRSGSQRPVLRVVAESPGRSHRCKERPRFVRGGRPRPRVQIVRPSTTIAETPSEIRVETNCGCRVGRVAGSSPLLSSLPAVRAENAYWVEETSYWIRKSPLRAVSDRIEVHQEHCCARCGATHRW